jgi:hypothetical protein
LKNKQTQARLEDSGSASRNQTQRRARKPAVTVPAMIGVAKPSTLARAVHDRLRACPAFRGAVILSRSPNLAGKIERALRKPGLCGVVAVRPIELHVRWVRNDLLSALPQTTQQCAEATGKALAALGLRVVEVHRDELPARKGDVAAGDYSAWSVTLATASAPRTDDRTAQRFGVLSLAYELAQAEAERTGTFDWKRCQRNARARLTRAR